MSADAGPGYTTEGLEEIRRGALALRGQSGPTDGDGHREPADRSDVPEGVFARIVGGIGHLALGSLLIVFVTGAWLTFRYRPSATASLGGDGSWSETISNLHGWASWAGLVAAAIWLTVWAAPRVGRSVIFAVPTVALAVLLMVTGRQIAWSQLAVAGGLVNQRLMGVWPVFDADLQFGIVRGVQITRASLRWSVSLHLAVAAVFALGVWATLVWFRQVQAVSAARIVPAPPTARPDVASPDGPPSDDLI